MKNIELPGKEEQVTEMTVEDMHAAHELFPELCARSLMAGFATYQQLVYFKKFGVERINSVNQRMGQKITKSLIVRPFGLVDARLRLLAEKGVEYTKIISNRPGKTVCLPDHILDGILEQYYFPARTIGFIFDWENETGRIVRDPMLVADGVAKVQAFSKIGYQTTPREFGEQVLKKYLTEGR